MVQPKQASRGSNSASIYDELIIAVQQYRKRNFMTQGLFAEFVGVSDQTISNLERHRPITEDTAVKVREFLATAVDHRQIKEVKPRPKRIYLTEKLLVWARITSMPTESVEAVRALKDAYDHAKEFEGLASVPLIQLEVENALTLATRGGYWRKRRSS